MADALDCPLEQVARATAVTTRRVYGL